MTLILLFEFGVVHVPIDASTINDVLVMPNISNTECESIDISIINDVLGVPNVHWIRGQGLRYEYVMAKGYSYYGG